MRKTIYFVAGLLCFLLMPAWLTAQEKTITGKITDANLSPLSGVNIIISKSNKGTVTDADGQFTLAVPPAAKLIISTTGFKTQTITVAAAQADLQIKSQECGDAEQGPDVSIQYFLQYARYSAKRLPGE